MTFWILSLLFAKALPTLLKPCRISMSISRDARLKAARDNATLALTSRRRCEDNVQQKRSLLRIRHKLLQRKHSLLQMQHVPRWLLWKADVEAVTILENVRQHRGLASPGINKDDLSMMVDSLTYLQPSVPAANSTSALVSDQFYLPTESHPTIKPESEPPSNALTQNFLIGSKPWMGRPTLFRVSRRIPSGMVQADCAGLPLRDDIQVCCFLHLRKRGVGCTTASAFQRISCEI